MKQYSVALALLVALVSINPVLACSKADAGDTSSTPAATLAAPAQTSSVTVDTPALKTFSMINENFKARYMPEANFRRVSLVGSDFTQAVLTEANFREADLTSVDFSGADMQGADLRRSDLRGANLMSVNLRSARLKGAVMTGAVFNQGTQFPYGFVPEKHGLIFKSEL